jgi:hypothetical protein
MSLTNLVAKLQQKKNAKQNTQMRNNHQHLPPAAASLFALMLLWPMRPALLRHLASSSCRLPLVIASLQSSVL